MIQHNPEAYWTRVADEIGKRGQNFLAGDDNPYNRYKRSKFLRKFLDTIEFEFKTVLEIGCGPGGNLKHIATHHKPTKLLGVDISERMLEVAKQNLAELAELSKTDGSRLPYDDQSIDISLTVTVLQHNTDELRLKGLVQEICRVTRGTILCMEDIGSSETIGSTGDWVGRRIGVYESIFREYGFRLVESKFLNTKISRMWFEWIYRHFIGKKHHEGEPMGVFSKALMGLPLPLTKLLDGIFPEQRNLAKMVFTRA